ncbi:methyltransferase domain-containing protein [bacterium]|nr:methyltransferase domain-containing protein [bacterium]
MKYTLNIGCGDRTYIEYPAGYECCNVDERRELRNVDVVCDVTNLSEFTNASFDYILASDILEHFPLKKTVDILREWCRVLKVGGNIEFRVPNLSAICNHYIGHGDATHVSWLLYGGQDYPGNFHYVCFNRKMLTELCEQVGLVAIEYREEGTNFILLVKKK